MNAILPANRVAVDQPKIRFMNQGGALKGLVLTPFGQTFAGDSTEFWVHQRHQSFASCSVAPVPTSQQFSDLVLRIGTQAKPQGGPHPFF